MSLGARALELTRAQSALLEELDREDPLALERLRAMLEEEPPRLSVSVLSSKRVAAGSGVSYGHTFVAPAETTLALVAIGYGHGLPRKAGNRASLTWHRDGVTHDLPIVGRVAMNVGVADAGQLPLARGERVVVFGEESRGERGLESWSASVGESAVSLVVGLAAHAEWMVR